MNFNGVIQKYTWRPVKGQRTEEVKISGKIYPKKLLNLLSLLLLLANN